MPLRPLTLLATIISIVTGVALGIAGHRHLQRSQIDQSSLARFESVLYHVRQNYVEELSDEALLNGALKGLLQSLDPHSVYLDASEFEDLQAETTGHFGGIGIDLGLIEGFFTVIAPIDGTPAARAGLAPGDRLLELDDASLRGAKLIDVIHRLRGEPGSTVRIKYERADSDRLYSVDLVRENIAVASVSSRLLEPGYGYIRISQFQISTGNDFYKALRALNQVNAGDAPPHSDAASGAAAKPGLRGLVLDLRNNPGGVLQSSVAVADALLDDGLIVYTEGRLPSSKLKYRAASNDLLAGAPIVVLINQGSASASEIVAGALQDHQRALVVGETSYGKGSVQSLVPLGDEQAIKLTTAYYYTPSGRSIHKLGIEPDVEFTDNGDYKNFEKALFELALTRLKQSTNGSDTSATLLSSGTKQRARL